MKQCSLLLVFALAYAGQAHAGGPWSEQYCNARTETVVIKDRTGRIVDERVKETVVCDDGAKDFLQYSGIAENCEAYYYDVRLRGQLVTKRGFVCKKLGGGYEIVDPGNNRY